MKQLNPACVSLFFRRFVLFSILLSAVNLAYGQCPVPYPVGDLDSTHRNIPVSTVVTANDATSFSNNSPLVPDSLAIVSQPGHGTATVLNDSTIRYTPAAGYTGTDFYTYRVCNACGNCATTSVAILVTAYCPAPAPVADYYTIYNNVSYPLHVTANDVNVAGGPLTVSLRRLPAHGTASVSGTDITYLGNGTYAGGDTLSYIVCDSCPSHNCDTAYVYLTLVACTPAVAINDLDTVIQGHTTSVNVLTNDANTTGFGTAVVTLLSSPHFGSTATLGANGLLTYHAGGNGFGKDSILYRVCTDCGCDSAYAIFTVTQAPCTKPTIFADNEYSGYSSTCSSTYSILTNDNIPLNSGTVTVTIVSQPGFGTASIVNNKLVYTCTDSTRIGQVDQVIYSLCNACACDTGVVAVHISTYPCNGRNPIINTDSASVCRNFPVTFNVTGNDVDPEGGIVSVDTIVGAAQHGTARKVDANNVSYMPAANFSGHDVFVYQACDNGIPKLCNIATVNVYVLDCNTPPVILGAAHTPTDTIMVRVYEDSFTNYCFQYTQADSPYVYISSIGASLDTVTPTAGSTLPGTQPCIRIATPLNSTTQQSIQVIICNKYPTCDTVSVIVSVIPINHAPQASPDAFAYRGPGCTPVNVLVNDGDIDQGDHLTITHYDTTTSHGGTVTQVGDSLLCYTPDSSFAGIDTFSYVVCDTSHVCATSYVIVTVPITARNDHAATLQDQAVSIDVRANDSHTPVQFVTLCSMPVNGTATVDSAGVTYVPNHDYPSSPLDQDTTAVMGLDSFCYTLCSVSGTDTTCANAEVYVTVAPKSKFYIPQGISPNGDGINDKFVIVSADELTNSQLLVYNRYGDEVWRNDGDTYQNDFDGTWKKNGQPLPDMSYWYIFKFNDGKHQDRMGYIIIER